MRGASKHPLLNICWQPGLLSAIIATTELVLPPARICIPLGLIRRQRQAVVGELRMDLYLAVVVGPQRFPPSCAFARLGKHGVAAAQRRQGLLRHRDTSWASASAQSA